MRTNGPEVQLTTAIGFLFAVMILSTGCAHQRADINWQPRTNEWDALMHYKGDRLWLLPAREQLRVHQLIDSAAALEWIPYSILDVNTGFQKLKLTLVFEDNQFEGRRLKVRVFKSDGALFPGFVQEIKYDGCPGGTVVPRLQTINRVPTPHGDAILIRTYGQRQYYGLCRGLIRLLRIESEDGKRVDNNYDEPRCTIGERDRYLLHFNRETVLWSLNGGDYFMTLTTLEWLASQDISKPHILEMVLQIVNAPQVRFRLRQLADRDDPWIQEPAAEIVRHVSP